MIREAQNIALFDMDGTLCDHDKALKKDMEKLKGPKENLPEVFLGQDTPPYLRERIELIRKQPGWWENLDKFKLGFDILNVAKKLGFEIYILTKGPSSKPNAWKEKVDWIRKNVEKAKITITEDKGLVYGKVLVDDYPHYIEAWLKHRPRGLVIMPIHSYNQNYNHPRVIRYDGKNLSQIKTALKRVKERRPLESI